MWLTSWGWTRSIDPPDHKEIQRVAQGGTNALNARHGKRYEYGSGGAILYPAAGAEDDWAKGQAGIKYSYTLELRPGPYASNGFILPARKSFLPERKCGVESAGSSKTSTMFADSMGRFNYGITFYTFVSFAVYVD